LTAWELNSVLYSLNQKWDSNYLTNYKWAGISITSLSDFWNTIMHPDKR
jgi:hypothetical protein